MSKPEAHNGNNTANGATNISPKNGVSTDSEGLSVSRAKEAIKSWYGFQDAAKEMLKHSEALGKVEEILDNHFDRADVAHKNGIRVAELQSAIQELMVGYEQRYSTWKEEKCQLERRVKDLESEVATGEGVAEKQNINHKQAVAQIKKETESEKKTVAKLTKELETANAKTQQANTKLDRCNEQLKEWEGSLSLLKELDFKVFDTKIKQLFTRCAKIARTHFLRDLPKEAFLDYGRWEDFPKVLKVQLSFPPTNSAAAKHMRMAAAMHIVADRLCTNFFRPSYLPEYTDAGDPMKEILGQQYTNNKRRERMMRSLLLSTYSSKDIDEAIKQTVQDTSEDVCQLLSLIGGSAEGFQKDIKSFFSDAASVWKEAQCSNKMVEASTTEDYEDWQWDKLEDFTSAVGETEPQSTLPRFEALNLLPCIFVPEIQHTVDRGCVLWPSQNTVIAAEQEFTKCPVRKPKIRKPSFAGGRRLSTQSDGLGVKSDERPAFLDTKQRATLTEAAQTTNGKRGS
ncbi:hypothetical protein MMC07_000878 [Pseudocyphellaria aurata]|nr:hypothetical protein [Pseudocyphellaria aurata]